MPLDRWIRPLDLQRAGGLTLAVLGLGVLGLPIAAWQVFAVLSAGILLGLVRRRWSARRP